MSTHLLDIKNVSLSFPGLEAPILNNINYEVRKNDFIIILGSNGSGKSSLMKLIDRRYRPTSGNIFLDEKLIESYPGSEFSNRVITLTQNCHDSLFASLTVLENYLLVKQRHEAKLFAITNKKERDFFAKYVAEFNPNLPKKLNQIVDKLSGGEKQALALALSVLYPPEILLLDEHTSALDPKSARQLMALTQQVVTQHHITCMMTTHDLDIAMNYGNRILALKQGEIYQTIDYANKAKVTEQELLAACY